MDFITEVY